MKSDEFIREVEEELRQDRMKSLWDQYGLLVIGVALAIVLGTAGTVGWTYWQESQANAVARDYVAAAEQIRDGADGEAVAALQEFADGAAPGFASIARLRAAALSAAAEDQQQADALLAQVVDGGADTVLVDLAKLSQASHDLADGDGQAAFDAVAGLAAGEGPFQSLAKELQAAAQLELGQTDAAIATLQELSGDPLLEDPQRRRVDELLAALGAGAAE